MPDTPTAIKGFRHIDASHVQVLGLLNMDTVVAYEREGFKALDAARDLLIFDLAEIEITGSAVIALLISWQRKSIQLKKKLLVANASSQLLEMADLAGVRDIIEFLE